MRKPPQYHEGMSVMDVMKQTITAEFLPSPTGSSSTRGYGQDTSSSGADYTAPHWSPSVTSSQAEQRYVKPRSLMRDRYPGSPASGGGAVPPASLQSQTSNESHHSAPSPGGSRPPSVTHAHSPASSDGFGLSGGRAFMERPGSRGGYAEPSSSGAKLQHRVAHQLPPAGSDYRATSAASPRPARKDDGPSSADGSSIAREVTSSAAATQSPAESPSAGSQAGSRLGAPAQQNEARSSGESAAAADVSTRSGSAE